MIFDMEPKSFGEYLKVERELRNISLEEVSQSTKIHVKYLKAIEENEFDLLPAETFIKGFIRSFAKSIGLDENDVILTYEYYQKVLKGGNGLQSPGGGNSWNGSRKLIIIIGVLVTLLIFILILAYYFSNFSVHELNSNIEISINNWTSCSKHIVIFNCVTKITCNINTG
ncbi:MAG: hypothetical protein A2161_10060 [Candidatus Schekmanbacteria bacterium RBG_13_48_7]|uniref:HTH cro/C1-type domain-containing protein n=1 Tax=Candidatus Schekmanbacteria bacterium RBG_13_48_7 TaxID=1817878 RepID=A0A1F7RZ21_9BACT|nr:MAG: hypothetical protein A2161_10060 [Candidatus Schekmanbacteria bacterium RBG_13_48_7]